MPNIVCTVLHSKFQLTQVCKTRPPKGKCRSVLVVKWSRAFQCRRCCSNPGEGKQTLASHRFINNRRYVKRTRHIDFKLDQLNAIN